MKYIKIIIINFVLIIFAGMFSTKVFATFDYTITSYDINMFVNEDNTIDITENITVNFNTSKHGIYRKIPLNNKIMRTDGTTANINAKIKNLSVSDNYESVKKNGYLWIKIGDENKTYSESKNYVINYTYDLGKDQLKGADELYYNIIGTEWETEINNVSFTIIMPKEFDESSLGFSSGYKWSINSSKVRYYVDETVIYGDYIGTLNPGEAVTVRMTLPEGYFIEPTIEENKDAPKNSNVSIAISVAFVAIAFLLWKKYGKDEEVVETVEFYPVDDFNSAEIAYFYNGEIDDKGVISLLIYLANKGYLKIDEDDEIDFKITKLKEYDGDKKSERKFFYGLFGDTTNKKESVTKLDLYNKFYKTLSSIKSDFNKKKNKEMIFQKKSFKKVKWLVMMIIILPIVFLINLATNFSSYGELAFCIPSGLWFSGMALIPIGFGLKTILKKYDENKNKYKIIIFLLGVLDFIPNIIMHFIFKEAFLKLLVLDIITISLEIIVFLMIAMPKRNEYGNKVLGKIKGFKRFLETAEKQQLEMLVEESPEYFYKILPYTYALGVSDKWIKKFETIAFQKPNWYQSKCDFEINHFNSFMKSTMISATNAMTASPYDRSSSSGGGFSGGGSGGGGGGAW